MPKTNEAANAANPKVDAFLGRTKQWRAEFGKLRDVILGCGLSEDFKWGWPCYAHEGANVVLIHGFKEYCAVLFMKGALLKDPAKVLIQQTENVQAARQMRFTNAQEVAARASTLKAYVREAVALEKAGAKVELKKPQDFPVAGEFKKALDASPALKKAFEALTPGRQRGYLLYFSGAKRAETREERVEKCRDRIMDGKGLDD